VKVGDLVKWSWHLDTDWTQTYFVGIIIGSKLYKTDREKIRVLKVLDNTGQATQVREDEASLELVNERW
jgi:hypothetical protein